MYRLKMVTIRFNYGPRRRIEVDGERIVETVTERLMFVFHSLTVHGTSVVMD